MLAVGSAALSLVAGCAGLPARPGAVAPGARYVALGSSYAAGPGTGASADDPATRCARSSDNYPHQLARALRLRLVDVSCSGATTAHLLGPWNELPPQLDAIDADTRLVTMSVGGNNVRYVSGLGAAACATAAPAPSDLPGGRCPTAGDTSEDDWRRLEGDLHRVIAEIRRRAPAARIIVVDYPKVLPARGTCPAVAMTAAQADALRRTAARLEAATARVTAAERVELLRASRLSRDHDACSAVPWMNGFPHARDPRFVPFHPNTAGMTALATALARRIDAP